MAGGRFRNPKTGRLYGGESAPKRDALGNWHHDDTDNSDGFMGRSNRIYGQNRPKLPRPPKGKPRIVGAKKRAL